MSLTLYEEDVSIYQKDLDTLKPRQWLNDQIISFSMARIEKTLSDIDASVRFLDASLVSCLRLQLDDEVQNPYGEGHPMKIDWPDKVEADPVAENSEETEAAERPAGGGHGGH